MSPLASWCFIGGVVLIASMSIHLGILINRHWPGDPDGPNNGDDRWLPPL